MKKENVKTETAGAVGSSALLGKLGDAIRKTLPAVGVNAEVTVDESKSIIVVDADKGYVQITLSGTAELPKFGIAACETWSRQQLIQSPPAYGMYVDGRFVRKPLGRSPKEMRMRLKYARHRWLVWFSGFRDNLMEFPFSIIRVMLPFNYPVSVHNLPNDSKLSHAEQAAKKSP